MLCAGIIHQISSWLMLPGVGRSAVDNCMSGLNSAVFAYGQTGAGKTHTMLGRLASPKALPSNEVRSSVVCKPSSDKGNNEPAAAYSQIW